MTSRGSLVHGCIAALVAYSACASPPPPSPTYAPPTTQAVLVQPQPEPEVETLSPQEQLGSEEQMAAVPDIELPLPLRSFYEDLHALSSKERSEHVRIAWFGDSHTAGDFWSDGVRVALQERFGNGGPGLIQLGARRYRHGRARVRVAGRWQVIPKVPAGTHPPKGVFFGLFGAGTTPLSSNATARIWLPHARDNDRRLSWHLFYQASHTVKGLRVRVGSAPAVNVPPEASPSAVGFSQLRLETEPQAASFAISNLPKQIRLFGVAVESSRAGVVLDTLGINGARAVTALAWPEKPWIAALAEREPSLVVLSYGTNEVGDGRPASEYTLQFVELVDRVRIAAPEADCLLIGPTDRAKRNWQSYSKVAEIDQVQKHAAESLGCAYFSAFEAMGGEGAIRRWAFREFPLARKDRVHLTAAGYERLATALTSQLMSSYELLYPEARALLTRQ